jgi:hypothetical protein
MVREELFIVKDFKEERKIYCSKDWNNIKILCKQNTKANRERIIFLYRE